MKTTSLRLLLPFALGVGVSFGTACGGGGETQKGASDDGGSSPTEPGRDASDKPKSDGDLDATTADGAAGDAAAGDATTADAAAGDAAAADGAAGDGAAGDAAAGDAGSDAAALDAGGDAGTNDDPFDPASCGGAALTGAQATALLGAAARVKLADATLYRRTRSCVGAACGAWGAPVVHTQALLTYSGGVVTDYKTFSFPTHLVLFSQSGQPRLSIRHTSDYLHDATASTRGVVFSFGADPMENTYPVIYVWDFAPAPNRYDDLQGLLGDKAQLHAAEHCARVVVTNGMTTEIAALYRY